MARADQEREARALRLDQLDPAVKRDGPADDERHVGGDQQRRDRGARQCGEHHRRPETDAGAVERAAGEKHEDGADRVENRRRRAHAPFGVAANLGGEPDDPGDQRGLGEIAEGEVSRPKPILRLVEENIGLGVEQRQQSEDEQARKDRQQPKPIVSIRERRGAVTRTGLASVGGGLQGGSLPRLGTPPLVQGCTHKGKLASDRRIGAFLGLRPQISRDFRDAYRRRDPRL